ncbi:ribosomal-processing cysteine protease Prp [Selenomonadales bacterium OttesenSCG-928-I06]|nr:ribosomal-processing cysteine protease Prp [Selenomonadales bacterium OttesenSCG-928-I06]
MIIIEIINIDGKIKKFKVTGHAGVSHKGQDIVCAGVSAVVQTAVIGLERHLNTDFDVKQSEGNLEVNLKKPDNYTEAILMTMYYGLKEIEKIYPKNVKIDE